MKNTLHSEQNFDYKPRPDAAAWSRLAIYCSAVEAFDLQQQYCDALLARAGTSDLKERARLRLQMDAAVRRARRLQRSPLRLIVPLQKEVD